MGFLHTKRFVLIVLGAAALLATLGAASASADPPPAGAGTTSHGFLVDRGAVRTIDHPGATTMPATPTGQAGSATLGINDRGQILGAYEGKDRLVRHFVRDRRGRYSPIPGPPVGRAYEYADLNNRGEIAGFYNDEQGATTSAFLRTKSGRFIDINFPGSLVTGVLKANDRRQVVGLYGDAEKLHGLLWDNGRYTTIDVPGATATVVLGINNRGQTVGSWVGADGAYHAFLRQRDGGVTTLPDAPGGSRTSGGTQPTSINDHGQIVGLVYDSQGGSRAFRYDRGSYALFDGARGAVYTRALDIDNRGRIVGDYGTRPGSR